MQLARSYASRGAGVSPEMNQEAFELVNFSEAKVRRNRATLMIAIGLCLLLQAWLVFTLEINWDEFLYLSQIYDYQRGEMTKALQTMYVHLLGWVTAVPGDEIDQIVVGRVFMLACVISTCVSTYLLARAFVSRSAALLAVLAFASAGFTVIHGASFRADPLTAAILMTTLALLARAPMRLSTMLAAALAIAMAAMITVKVVLYAPAFAGVAWWRVATASDRARALRWFGAVAVAAALAFGILYAIQLSLLPDASNANSQKMLGNAASTTLLDAGLVPRSREIWRAALLSPWQSLLMIAGVAALVTGFRLRTDRASLVAVTGCGAVALSLLFYRNAFPYFFPFIMPPVCLLVAWAIERIALLRPPLVRLALVVPMLIPAVTVAVQWSVRGQDRQAAIIAAVHSIFPRPVPYIDRNGMVASFPKRGFFMSTWGMQSYQARKPIFADVLAREPVPLLILNHPALGQAVGTVESLNGQPLLFEADRQVLRDNYIEHWGPIWVAGKLLVVGSEDRPFSIAIPGVYTLEGGPAQIDGKTIGNRGTVRLARGEHRIRGKRAGSIALRWGRNLRRPEEPPPAGPVYFGF